MTPAHDRRQRLHELVIALIAQQDDLPLLDRDQPAVAISLQTSTCRQW